jgi:hypothetical protein
MELLCATEHVPRGAFYFQVILHMEMIVIPGIIIINQCKSVRYHAHLTSQCVPELDSSSSSIMDWLGMFVKVSKGTCRI